MTVIEIAVGEGAGLAYYIRYQRMKKLELCETGRESNQQIDHGCLRLYCVWSQTRVGLTWRGASSESYTVENFTRNCISISDEPKVLARPSYSVRVLAAKLSCL